MWTPLISSTKLDFEFFLDNAAMGKPGQPIEVASAFLFLASKAASYISGATLPIIGWRITK
ncbi:SDR family oxidoreductase [Pedobacter sp. ASV28]|uniref:SDR family oxidoreductase n=1 Tax=Pedobacter sp. ASV28 TaxID=2795123 RepID=UPI0018EB2C20|nr:SDR family oxidoreductase [Pedobacter sp. ASV28]